MPTRADDCRKASATALSSGCVPPRMFDGLCTPPGGAAAGGAVLAGEVGLRQAERMIDPTGPRPIPTRRGWVVLTGSSSSDVAPRFLLSSEEETRPRINTSR